LAQLINNHLDNLDKLEEVVVENADTILPSIKVDDLLKDPENYLLALGDAFLKEHIDEIERLKMESNTIKAGLGLIDSNNETIFSKDIIWYNINNHNYKS